MDEFIFDAGEAYRVDGTNQEEYSWGSWGDDGCDDRD